MRHFLGNLLDRTRQQHAKGWKIGFFVFLAVLLLANIFVHPHHAEFGLDAYTGFWAAFGLVLTVLVVFVMKKIIQPLLVRPEETFDVE